MVAETTGVSARESDVSGLSPGGSPGVLDLPVSANDSDQEDSMVESGLAVAEDSGLVGTPVGGIDGNGDRLAVYSVVEGGAAREALLASDLEVSSGLCTFLVSASVFILALS